MPAIKQFLRALLPRAVRNWVRAPRKSLSWGWGELRYLLGAREVVELRPGWPLVCHPLAYGRAYHEQREDPAQVAELDTFIAHCRPGMVLFDIGAHFGLFSLAALHYGGPDARAVAVDPSPVAARMTAIQARLNGVADRLQVIQACACDSLGTRPMVAVGVLAGGHFVAPSQGHTRRETTVTPATTLDELARQTGLRPTHLKIDVEGQEESVLRGSLALLAGEPAPVLFLELHAALIREGGGDPAAVLSLLEENGYAAEGSDGVRLSEEALLSRPLTRFVARRVAGTSASLAAAPACLHGQD
jgi:FkbM family methyltransferase